MTCKEFMFIVGFFSVASAFGWSQALLTGADAALARQAMDSYTNNVLRIDQAEKGEWDDSNPQKIKDLFPANMPFHLVAGPEAADRQMAEAAVNVALTSMPVAVRQTLTERGKLAPVLQWLLRRCRPGVTNEATYLTSAAHPTVWQAKDFDLKALAAKALMLTKRDTPLVTTVKPLYETAKITPIKRAAPLVDYPDPRPEVTYETPYGAAIVLRAYEGRRKFRFVAEAWPVNDKYVSFKWTSLSRWGISVRNAQRELDYYPPANGCCDLELQYGSVRVRLDMAVFARYGEGPYGPPAIISFYVVPNERRTYDREGRIAKIEYQKAERIIPELYQNKLWVDEFTVDDFGHVFGFMRKRTGGFREEKFSIDGDCVLETHANDLPKVTAKVRYFTSSTDPTVLDYEVTDEERRYPLQSFTPRSRGEFPTVRQYRR